MFKMYIAYFTHTVTDILLQSTITVDLLDMINVSEFYECHGLITESLHTQ